MAPIIPMAGEPLLAHTRHAAEQLVEALASARRRTKDWSEPATADALVHAALRQCLTRLAESHCWGPGNRPASNLLWQIAGDWLETGWLQRRARDKPRGYAGDFELLARIDCHYRCDHPLGRAWDTFFQEQTAAQAVRNRHQWLHREMIDMVRRRPGRAVRLASVGSGPACDVKAALTDLTVAERASTRVTLLDLDPAALDFAREELANLLPTANLRAVRDNLFRISRSDAKSAVLEGADLISCPGLFDYLDDADAAALLATFWNRLAPGGRMLVFNFAPHHPSQAYMEWIGNWYLTYRNQHDLESLATQGGVPGGCVSVSSESTQTDLVLVADKEIRPRKQFVIGSG